MSIRNERSNAVVTALEGRNGWFTDPFKSPELGSEWRHRFPNLPLVADVRKETGYTKAGRGTTAFDLFRTVESGGFIRTDFLSVKTERLDGGKLPSRLDLSTGNESTLNALIEGIKLGASLPTLVFASGGVDGMMVEEGYALFLDLGPALRGGVAEPVDGGYARGEAPPVYYRWSSARPCGGKSKHLARAEMQFPHIDEQGRKWIAPDKVCYRELVVSLSKCGVTREHWSYGSVNQLAAYIEQADWNGISLGI